VNPAELDAAIAEARQPNPCRRCGGLYIGAAFTVHRDGDRCLPGDAYGQLVQVDGAWHLRGSEPAGR
jgi:hypothetical protein